MPDDLPRREKVGRLQELQRLQDSIQAEANSRIVGQVHQVLVEGRAARGGGQMAGRTEGGLVVNLEAPEDLLGRIIPVVITEAGVHSLRGRLAVKLDKLSV